MQKQRTGRQAHDAQNAVQGLRKHALNFPTDETGERQHVALDPAFFFLVQGHDHQHGYERRGHRAHGTRAARHFARRVTEKIKKCDAQSRPNHKRNRQQSVHQRFLPPVLAPKNHRHADKNCPRWNDHRHEGK